MTNPTYDFRDCLRNRGADLPTRASLNGTLGELAADQVACGVNYDCAKPQNVVDYWRARGVDIRGESVVGYIPGNIAGFIVPLTLELAATFDAQSLDD